MTNPLLADWKTPFALPPFEQIEDDHFSPAFEAAMEEARANITKIAENADAPTFANTIEALEQADATLNRVLGVFFNLSGADSNPKREALERDISPKLAAYGSEITNNKPLFQRIETLWTQRDDLKLTEEQARVLMLTRRSFVRSGADLEGYAADRLTEVKNRLAVLSTQFTQNLLADERDWYMELAEAELEGLPDFLIAAARAAGHEKGLKAPIITTSRSLIVPFLQFSPRRDLRERAYEAWQARGANGGATDNRAIAAEVLVLREERAMLLGYDSFADYKLETEMAKTPEAVKDLLMQVWEPALTAAEADGTRLAAMMHGDGVNGELEPWDWRYYSEMRRKEEHDLDEAELKPYLQLDRMVEAAFTCATRLFDLQFEPLDVALYHPDARAWEVTRDGEHVAVFIADYFARGSKRSGAWCSAMRQQQKLAGDIRPIVVNVCNFAKPAQGKPALLSYDDARTLFHEFGHALHQMLSDVTYEFDLRHLRGARFRGTAQPAVRTLAGSARGAGRIRHPCRDRRSDAAGSAATGCWRRRPTTWGSGLSNSCLLRWSIWPSTRKTPPTIRCRSRRTCWRASECPTPSGCATPRRISPMSSPATAIPRAITPTCGQRSWMPTPSRRSRRRAERSTRRWPGSCTATSCRPAARKTRKSFTQPSAARCPAPRRFSKVAACYQIEALRAKFPLGPRPCGASDWASHGTATNGKSQRYFPIICPKISRRRHCGAREARGANQRTRSAILSDRPDGAGRLRDPCG